MPATATATATGPPKTNDRHDTMLAEPQAFAIATRWRHALAGHVALSSIRATGEFTLAAHSEWVHIAVSHVSPTITIAEAKRQLVPVALAARASALVWLTLSCCPGFALAENPAFWRRVFQALSLSAEHDVDGALTDDDEQATAASNASLRHGSHAWTGGASADMASLFPRMLLQFEAPAHHEEILSTSRLFFGTTSTIATEEEEDDDNDGEEEEESPMCQLPSQLLALMPFVDRRAYLARIQQGIDVGLALPSLEAGSATLLSSFATAPDQDQDQNQDQGQTDSGLPWPRFHVRALRVAQTVGIADVRDVDSLAALLQQPSLTIPELDVSVLPTLSAPQHARLLHTLLSIPPTRLPHSATMTACTSPQHGSPRGSPSSSVVSLRFARHTLSDAQFQGICSALPFARSPQHYHALRFRTTSMERRTFTSHDLPWLAYACFHPEADRSSWHALELQDLRLSPHSASILRAMSRGNNLLALLRNQPTIGSRFYYSSELPAGTCIRTQPRGDAACVTVLVQQLRVDLCIESGDVSTWRREDWIAVIVPGFGLGYVSVTVVAASSHSLWARSPSVSCLRALRLGVFQLGNPVVAAVERLLSFVALATHRLEFLDISKWGELDGETLRVLLATTPALMELSVQHSGAFQAMDAMEEPSEEEDRGHDTDTDTDMDMEIDMDMGVEKPTTMPTIRALEIVLPAGAMHLEAPSMAMLRGSLRHLEALRVVVNDRDVLPRSCRALARMLHECPRLVRLHWENPRHRHRHGSGHSPTAMACMTKYAWNHDMLAAVAAASACRQHHDPTRCVAMGQGRLHGACAVAFLASLKRLEHERGPSAAAAGRLRRLGRSVLGSIFAFATSNVPRHLCLDQPVYYSTIR